MFIVLAVYAFKERLAFVNIVSHLLSDNAIAVLVIVEVLVSVVYDCVGLEVLVVVEDGDGLGW